MQLSGLKIKKNDLIILSILFILALFSLWVRALPLLNLNTDILNIVGSDDPLYNLRQIELVLHNYPQYSWFEAMTLFPTGQTVPWGPLFIWICSTACLLAGASTRPEIIAAALWIPPIFGALMVPLVFLLVRRIWDWKAGLFGAFLIAFVGGQYFFRSLAGYLDHHIAEVFFSTLFILVYIIALLHIRDKPIDMKKWESLKYPLLYSIFAGIAYILGFYTMPTMILFAFVVAIFTVVMVLADFHQKRSSLYLVLLNSVVFGLAFLSSLAIGIHSSSFSLPFYSLGHPVSYLLVIAGTVFLYYLSRKLEGKSSLLFLGIVIAIGLLGLIGMAVALPQLYEAFIGSLLVFFGLNPYAITVQEARPWTLAEAWETFNFGLLLMIGGIFVILYKIRKEIRPELIFVLVWSVYIIIAAFRQIRYEYYLAVNIAVLGAIFTVFALEMTWPDIKAMGRRTMEETAGKDQETDEGKGKKREKEKGTKKTKQQAVKKKAQKTPPAPQRPKVRYISILFMGIILAFVLIFAYTSFSYDYGMASTSGLRMNQDWRETLEWMNSNTPETGVDYLTIYDKETFSYPSEAYGVMSWWDYGHMITYIAKRIPNANPFQAGVSGKEGAAAFFVTGSEAYTNSISDAKQVGFVITDIEMDTGKFWAMAQWFNSSAGVGPYQKLLMIPDDPTSPTNYNAVPFYTQPYFMSTVSRLHNFDGSMTVPTVAYYVEYTDKVTQAPYPVVVAAQQMEVSQAKALADQYNSQAQPGYHADVVSNIILLPLDTVPALKHYRLVHESPSNVFSQTPPDVKYVKVFEYVPGARISGEGIIELDLVTNTGRKFTYRQASENGEFIVPYSTSGNPYDVKAVGKYRIAGTDREFDVGEDAILQGLAIN
jgi:oligosaccharyl transferase (archaeosortase A-associated)